MSGINAIFVDGTGHLRETVIKAALPTYSFALPMRLSACRVDAAAVVAPSIPETSTAIFQRLGRLADGRVVYGQAVSKMELWFFTISVTEEAQYKCPFDIAEYELIQWMQHETREPTRCLLHTVTSEPAIKHHRYEGIGRTKQEN